MSTCHQSQSSNDAAEAPHWQIGRHTHTHTEITDWPLSWTHTHVHTPAVRAALPYWFPSVESCSFSSASFGGIKHRASKATVRKRREILYITITFFPRCVKKKCSFIHRINEQKEENTMSRSRADPRVDRTSPQSADPWPGRHECVCVCKRVSVCASVCCAKCRK